MYLSTYTMDFYDNNITSFHNNNYHVTFLYRFSVLQGLISCMFSILKMVEKTQTHRFLINQVNCPICWLFIPFTFLLLIHNKMFRVGAKT